jgi:GT2 family glycosyltransferase
MKKNISIILVNWNGKNDTIECIKSLLKLEKNNFTFNIIVVDNGSTDGSEHAIVHMYGKKVIIIPNTENLGFAEGNNRGIIHALKMKSSSVWLLNNDTTVHPKALSELFNAEKKYGNGIFGSKIFFSKNHEFHKDRYKKNDLGKVIWYAGGKIDWKNMYASHYGVDEVDHGQFIKNLETEFITGCSMYISRDVIDTIGYLDNDYYLYLEDVDFCLRAKQKGYVSRFIPSSIIWHKNAGSTSRPGNRLQEYYLTRNRIIVSLRYAKNRTKIAVFREAFQMLFFGSNIRKRAVLDVLFGKLGRGYQWEKI